MTLHDVVLTRAQALVIEDGGHRVLEVYRAEYDNQGHERIVVVTDNHIYLMRPSFWWWSFPVAIVDVLPLADLDSRVPPLIAGERYGQRSDWIGIGRRGHRLRRIG